MISAELRIRHGQVTSPVITFPPSLMYLDTSDERFKARGDYLRCFFNGEYMGSKVIKHPRCSELVSDFYRCAIPITDNASTNANSTRLTNHCSLYIYRRT
jgi:hypothetical protein